jgi:uncharacterized protein involved in tolerance to divalent cations
MIIKITKIDLNQLYVLKNKKEFHLKIKTKKSKKNRMKELIQNHHMHQISKLNQEK